MSNSKPNKDISDKNKPFIKGWVGRIKNKDLNSSPKNIPGGYPLATLNAGIK